MIVCIQPLEMWSGNTDMDKAVYLEWPDGQIELDKEVENCDYGENHEILIDHLKSKGAKQVPCPIEIIYV